MRMLSAEIDVLYPEEVFPQLRPLLESAVENAPNLRSQLALIDEHRGEGIIRQSAGNARLRFEGRLLGGYEMRSEAPANGDRSGAIGTLDGNLWWEKPIFAWGNIERLARMGELGVEAGRLAYADVVRMHLNEVRDTFLRWQLAERQMRLLDENVLLAARIVSNQRELLEAGRVAETQVLDLEARLQETEEERMLFERERQYFRDHLEVLVGDAEAVARIGMIDFPDFQLPEGHVEAWTSVLKETTFDHPGVARERRYAEIDATYAEVVANNQRPSVDLVAGLVSDRVDSANIDDSALRLVSYVGLQVRWNIFDGRRSEGERMVALARKRAREARLEAAEAELRDQAGRLVANLRLHQAQVDVRTQRAAILSRRLALAENPGTGGRIAPLEHLELRLDFLAAEQRTLDAKANYLTTLTQLAALIFRDPVADL